MSSFHNDLETWANKARGQGLEHIYLDIDTALQISATIMQLANDLDKTVAENKFLDGRVEALTVERQTSSREWRDAFDGMHKRAMDAEALPTQAEARDAGTIEKLVDGIQQARKRMRNCRGAIESDQVVDKDVHGSLTRGMADIDAVLINLLSEGEAAFKPLTVDEIIAAGWDEKL